MKNTSNTKCRDITTDSRLSAALLLCWHVQCHNHIAYSHDSIQHVYQQSYIKICDADTILSDDKSENNVFILIISLQYIVRSVAKG